MTWKNFLTNLANRWENLLRIVPNRTTQELLLPIISSSTFMHHYTPRAITPEQWEQVREFTARAVIGVFDEGTEHQLRLAARSVARLAVDALDYGRELTNEQVFDAELIEYHCANLGLETTTVSSVRALLSKIGRELSMTWEGDDGTVSYPTSMKNTPYNEDEIKHLHGWAQSGPTSRATTGAQVLLALGLGAGLRGCEVDTLRVKDVQREALGLVVYPSGYRGAQSRYVPVHADYARFLESAIADLEPDDLVFLPGARKTGAKSASDFVGRMPTSRVPVTLSRMRTTWIVSLMRAHVPESAICEASGLRDLQHYARFREVAKAPSAREFDRQIRFAGTSNFPPLKAV
ncbi:integrase [Corynebacterium afermentans]